MTSRSHEPAARPSRPGRAAGARGDDTAVATAGRPLMLVVVCVLVLIEALLLVAVGIAFGAQLVRGATVPGAAAFLLAFMLAVAAVLVASARGLWRGRRWSRSPVLTWQLLLAVLAFGWIGVEVTWWAGLILGAAVVVGVGLVLPSVVAVTTGAGSPTD